MKCNEPIGFDTLAAYYLGELSPQHEIPLEEHFFACAHCTGQLEEVAALAAGTRAVVKEGRVSLVASAPFVDAMKRAGLSLREYQLNPGGSVNCTIGADDDAVISRLHAPLVGVKRLDVLSIGGGEEEVRLTDVPFDAQTGEVLLIPSAAWLKSMPTFTMRMRLIAVGETGENPIGEYLFNHSPS
jgi:hypothetical protein